MRISRPPLDTTGGYYGETTDEASAILARLVAGQAAGPEGTPGDYRSRRISNRIAAYAGRARGRTTSAAGPGEVPGDARSAKNLIHGFGCALCRARPVRAS
jgi:hypothetical protein